MVVKQKSNADSPSGGIQKVSGVPLSRGPGDGGERLSRRAGEVVRSLSDLWIMGIAWGSATPIAGSSSYVRSLFR